MNKRWIFLLLLAAPAPSFAQISVIVSGGFSAALQELLPEFEKTTGIAVTTTRGASQGDSPTTIGAQLRRGVPADIVIMSKEGLEALVTEGRIVPGTSVDLAQTPLGVAVRAGNPRPVSALSMLSGRRCFAQGSVTFPGSTTGIYLTTRRFPQLGIANEMARKVTPIGVASVASGDAELAVQPVSELLNVPRVDFVGTIPAEIQYISVFSAAIVAGSKQTEASKRLIAFLESETATQAIRKSGWRGQDHASSAIT